MAQAAKAPTFDAGDPDHVAARGSRLATYQALQSEGLRLIMQTKPGRAWMHALLGFCGIGRTCFRGNSETFFLEGMQNVGHKLLADITRSFKKEYILMLEEGEVSITDDKQ